MGAFPAVYKAPGVATAAAPEGDSRNAFRVSILWGLGCLFLPFVSLFFLITNWDKAGRPFLIGLLGAAVLVGGVILTPRPERGALHSYQHEVAADAE